MAGTHAAVVSDVAREYLRLHLASDVGPVRVRNLLEHFGSIGAVLSAAAPALQSVDQVGRKVATAILRCRTDDDSVDHEIRRASECGVLIVCPEDAGYPQPLNNIPDPPLCLYIRGRLDPTDAVSVALVGTRKCSHYGREQALRFGELLGAAGFTVVSGLARGVDGHAHRGALNVRGRTIAVLGNGLSEVYPPEHAPLAGEIANAGAIVSEFPIDARPDPGNFPRRNRIIAGLTLGTIVIEAGRRSGALITARLASEYNREVFALPGRVDRPAETIGVNSLIRDGGAKLITCLDDVLDELADVGDIMRDGSQKTVRGSVATEEHDNKNVAADATPLPQLTPNERAVWDAIVGGAEAVQRIQIAARLDAASVLPVLTSLQLKGLVRQLPGGQFTTRRK